MLDAILKQAGLSEPGFTRKTIKWAINCTAEGRFTGVISLGDDGKGITFQCCPNLSQPELVGGDSPRSHFLHEGLPTVALFWKDDIEEKEREKFQAKHTFFRALLDQASEAAPNLRGAVLLLQNEIAMQTVRDELLRQKAKPTESACFRVDGQNLLEQTDWHEWWRNFRAKLKEKSPKAKPAIKMRCLLTGETVEPMATHPKIKGLSGPLGGLGTGDVLASFDKQAFQSFGLEQAANAAMSEETATAYSETLNWLIEKKSIKLGKVLTVYWFDKTIELEEDPLSFLVEPPSNQVAASAERKAKELLESIKTGKRPDLSNNSYYARTYAKYIFSGI